jgi:hypothetical protein
MILVQVSDLQYVLPQNFLKVIPFKSLSHRITLYVSTDMVIIMFLKLMFEENSCASVTATPDFLSMCSRLRASVSHSDRLFFLLCCVFMWSLLRVSVSHSDRLFFLLYVLL